MRLVDVPEAVKLTGSWSNEVVYMFRVSGGVCCGCLLHALQYVEMTFRL